MPISFIIPSFFSSINATKSKREHDIIKPNAGSLSEEPQKMECLFFLANKATVTMVTSATGAPLSKIKGYALVTYQIMVLMITP
jgi:hypothetical protein